MEIPYYPIFLNIRDKLCVVVGGGQVAERKVRGLLAAGARVRVVSPRLSRGIAKLADDGKLDLISKEYRSEDLRGAVLVFAATNNKEINRQIREEAALDAIMVNVADDPRHCDFTVPSTVRKEPILIALSTSGLVPGLSRRLRREIMESIGAEYRAYARRVGAFRKFLIETVDDGGRRRRVMKQVVATDISTVARMSLNEMKRRFLGENE